MINEYLTRESRTLNEKIVFSISGPGEHLHADEPQPSQDLRGVFRGTLACVHADRSSGLLRTQDCCTQDCESEKPPRSRHPCKHTRVYVQSRVGVQLYPTQRSRDLDPKLSHSSGNASFWIWKEMRDIIINGPIMM